MGEVEGKSENEPEKKVADLWKAANGPVNEAENRQFALEAWKQTVSVQMHFNDICMKIRNYATTMLAAVIGLAAYSTKEAIEVDLFGGVPVGTFIALGGLIGWVAFFAMDRHWYHNFLRASGVHANRIEKRWAKVVPEMLLSSQIHEESNRIPWLDSRIRLNVFYAIGGILLLLTAVIVLVAHPSTAVE